MEVKLVLVGGKNAGKEIPVRGPKFFIGRAEDCHLRPQSDRVSRHHAAILVEEAFVAVRDFGSKNGTYVNGEQIKSERELKTGDRLKIGPLEFEVQLAVNVGGKKKPKVHNVREAAARTVQTAADDDLDISDWLGEDEDEDDAPTATGVTDTQRLSAAPTAGGEVEDSAEMPDESPKKKKKKEEPTKIVGRFTDIKPTADSSRSAAADMLKRFFDGK